MLKKFTTYFFFAILFTFTVNAEIDPLPSWNEGAAKNRILQFIKGTTEKGGPHYIKPEERIATFDQDGTLWVEQPLYTQLFFALENLKKRTVEKPEYLTEEAIEKIVAETHSGMSIHAFHEKVQKWLEKAVHPRFKKPFTELVYQPMLEVLELFSANGFKNYIVSGGGQEFIRVYAEKTYNIPPERVLGSAGAVKYEFHDKHPLLEKLPKLLIHCNYGGKPETINLMIGRKPVAAFGNSNGDRQMLQWTQAGTGKTLELLVHHDDDVREYAYGKDSKIGTFSESLMNEANHSDWLVVSMKNDWKVIFPWQK
jgi:phosphoglycolate phosphatase-like HAD superfamily hydrolase